MTALAQELEHVKMCLVHPWRHWKSDCRLAVKVKHLPSRHCFVWNCRKFSTVVSHGLTETPKAREACALQWVATVAASMVINFKSCALSQFLIVSRIKLLPHAHLDDHVCSVKTSYQHAWCFVEKCLLKVFHFWQTAKTLCRFLVDNMVHFLIFAIFAWLTSSLSDQVVANQHSPLGSQGATHSHCTKILTKLVHIVRSAPCLFPTACSYDICWDKCAF